VGFILAILLVPVVVGIMILFVWWLKCKAMELTVTNRRTELRKGILSKSTSEVWHSNVRNIQIDQSFFQRVFGVGTIGISSAGQSGIEIQVAGLRDPEQVRSLIDQHRA
jgi:uncharacterized membrane protein YdbT with pleckstrin-like domain